MTETIQNFPIIAKKFTTDYTEILNLITGNECFLISEDNINQTTKRITAKNFNKKFRADNVVLVKTEADFGVAVGDAITLVDNTNYFIGVTQLIMTKRLILPNTNPNISISGSSYSNTSIVYIGSTGANGFFDCSNAGTLNLFFLTIIDGVGNNKLFNLSSLVTLAGDVYGNFLQFLGWGSLGNITNFTVFTLKGAKILRCGSLDVQGNDLTSVNFSDCLFYSPTVIGGAHLNLKGSVQSNISQSSFFLAQNDSAINIDPAINPTSLVGIGTSIGFTGYVISGIRGVINLGGGQVRVIVALGHSFNNGQSVLIQSTINYNGLFTVSNVLPTNGTYGTFDITATFVADETYGVAILMDGAVPKVENFFKAGSTGNITAYASNGAGGTTVTSTAHGRANSSTLFISGDSSFNYTGGYTIFNATANTFDIAKAFVANDASGVWNSGSLDQKNNAVNTIGTGSIVPDSQTYLRASNLTLFAFAGTTTFTRVIWTGNNWINSASERISIDQTGVITNRSRRATSLVVSAEINCIKSGGGVVTVNLGYFYRPAGGAFTDTTATPFFVPRSVVTGSVAMQVTKPATVFNLNPGDSIALGISLDASATLNITSAAYSVYLA